MPTIDRPERFTHIDIARGISILLVLLGHNWIALHEPEQALNFVTSFRMPLFFFLAGLFLKPALRFPQVVAGKADALLKPYAMTLLALGAVHILTGKTDAANYLTGMLYGNGATVPWMPLWFLTHLFAVYLFGWICCRLFSLPTQRPWIQGAFLIMLVWAGFEILDVFWRMPPLGYTGVVALLDGPFLMPGLPFSADLLPISGAFFLLGYFCRDEAKHLRIMPFWFAVALAAFVLLHWYFPSRIDLNMRRYDSLVVPTVTSLLAIYLVLSVARMLAGVAPVARLFSYIGSASLILLLFHTPVQIKSYALFTRFFGEAVYLNGVLSFVVTIGACLFLFELVRRVSPLRRLMMPHNRRSGGRQSPATTAPRPT